MEGASRLWVSKNVNISSGYVDLIAKNYQGDLKNINFTEPNAENLINEWVKTKTHGKITSIAEPGKPYFI